MRHLNTARSADFAQQLIRNHLVRFLLPGFIKRQRVPVYPVQGVFLGEIRGKDDRLYALPRVRVQV